MISENTNALWFVRVVCLLCIGSIWVGLLSWSGKKELDHDEFQHAHASWLMYKGQQPYSDFFEHHPAYYWNFLGLYYDAHGEDLGIFAWGRKWMLIAFAGSIFFLYLLGRELMGEVTGLLAALLFATNRLGNYPAMMMRADGWMLFFLLAGSFVYLRAWNRSFRWHDALLSGALLGLSFGFLPKGGFTILGLALLTAHQCTWKTGWGIVWRRKVPLLIFAGISFVPILLPFFIYGTEYFHHVYVVSTHLRPTFSPWPSFGRLFSSSFGLLPFTLIGMAVCLTNITRKTEASFSSVAVLLFFFLNIVQVLVTARPFIQAFNVFIPFVSLLGAVGVGWIAGRFSPREQMIGVSLVAVGGLLVNTHEAYWRHPPNMGVQISRMEELMEYIPEDEKYAGRMNDYPVFRFDGTFYWQDVSLKSLQAADPDFEHDFIEELRETRPLLVHENFTWKLDFDPTQGPRLDEFLQQNYLKYPDSPFWVRLK